MPQPSTNYQQKQLIRKYSSYASELKGQGVPDHRIIKELQDKGLDRQSIRVVIDNLAMPDADHRVATRNKMMWGAGLFLFGLVVTIGTYAYASAMGGGTYVIAFGAIIAGAAQFLRGLAAYNP
jgi:hypothetical protein